MQRALTVFARRRYNAFAARETQRRIALYPIDPEPGLFSILTAVWSGSPVKYMRLLADSIAKQNSAGHTEWVIVDNGVENAELSLALREIAGYPWVRLVRLEKNAGIVGGLRAALENATGTYTMAVDGDDLLYPDALRTCAHFVRASNYGPIFYTDEDKIRGNSRSDPYFKPDWDPVLFLNSPYIAHLGIVKREIALQVDAYTNRKAEGSPDWDLFMRFYLGGYEPTHIPELVYSWRIHSLSTAEDTGNKSYIYSSQRAVLQQYIDLHAEFAIRDSPFATGIPQFRIVKVKPAGLDYTTVVMDDESRPASSLAGIKSRFVVVQQRNLEPEFDDWLLEAETLFDLHPETVMIGGRVLDDRDDVVEAGQIFGYREPCRTPYRHFPYVASGYFGELWKQRSVSAVSSRFAVVRTKALEGVPTAATLGYLGAWVGANAIRNGGRVIYTPMLSARTGATELQAPCASEVELFARMNADLIPDRRWYSPHLSLKKAFRPGV